MADELSAELELSIKDALSSVDDLRDEIDKAIRDSAGQFEDDFAKAISGVPDVEINSDVTGVAPAIEGAITDADRVAPIDTDVDAVAPAITEAIASVDGIVPVDADTTDASASVDALTAQIASVDASIPVTADTEGASADVAALTAQLADVDAVLPVNADISPALAEIDAARAEIAPIDLEVTLDTSQAQDSLGGLQSSSDEAGDALDVAGAASDALGTSTSLTSGSIDAATNAIGGMLGKVGPLGAAIGGGVVALGSFTNQAVNSLGATQRLDDTMGGLARTLDTIDVGSLNVSFKELALSTGSSGSAMKNAAADAFEMTTSFGKGREESARYSEQILALAARAVALNPALGETGDVATRLSNALRSGRDRALIPYQLGLSTVEIQQRATSIALADGRTEVNAADKAMAGAALATEKFGSTLQTEIAQGAQNPILQLRSLGKEFASMTTEVGKPLVSPMLELLHEALPSVTAITQALGQLAIAGLPIVQTALELLTPLLQAFADGLTAIPPEALAAIEVIVGIAVAMSKIGGATSIAVKALELFEAAMATNPWTLAAIGIAAVITVLGLFTGGSEDAAQSTKELTDALAEQNGQFDENSIKIVADQLGELQSQMTKAGVSTGEYTTALQTATGTSKSARAAIKDYAENLLFSATTNEDFVKTLQKVSPELGQMAEQLIKNGATSSELKQKILEQIVATDDAGKVAERTAASELKLAQSNDFTKETTNAATEAAKAHKQATFEAMAATQQNTLATQAQAAADQLAVTAAQQQALAARSVADGQAAVALEHQAAALANDGATAAVYRYIAGTGTAKEASDALSGSTSALRMEFDLLLGNVIGAENAHVQYDTAVRTLNQSLIDNGAAINQTDEATQKNVTSLNSAVSAATSWSSAAHQAGASTQEQLTPLQNLQGELDRLAEGFIATGDTASLEYVNKIRFGVQKSIESVQSGQGPMTGAGQGLGGGLKSGADQGAGPMPGSVAAIVDQAGRDAGLAGANMHNIGLGIGMSLSGGMVDGLYANDFPGAVEDYVNAAIRRGIEAAEAHSPSKATAREIGLPMAQGLSLGLDKGASDVMDSMQGLVRGTIGAAAPGSAHGAVSSSSLSMQIVVNGVSDRDTARRVGRDIGDAAMDALTRRGFVTTARLG